MLVSCKVLIVIVRFLHIICNKTNLHGNHLSIRNCKHQHSLFISDEAVQVSISICVINRFITCYKCVTDVLHKCVDSRFNAPENFWWCDLYSALLKEVS